MTYYGGKKSPKRGQLAEAKDPEVICNKGCAAISIKPTTLDLFIQPSLHNNRYDVHNNDDNFNKKIRSMKFTILELSQQFFFC